MTARLDLRLIDEPGLVEEFKRELLVLLKTQRYPVDFKRQLDGTVRFGTNRTYNYFSVFSHLGTTTRYDRVAACYRILAQTGLLQKVGGRWSWDPRNESPTSTPESSKTETTTGLSPNAVDLRFNPGAFLITEPTSTPLVQTLEPPPPLTRPEARDLAIKYLAANGHVQEPATFIISDWLLDMIIEASDFSLRKHKKAE